MTAFGTAQQLLKNRMHSQAEPGLGPLHLRALCLCLRNPGWTQQQVVQAMGRDKGQMARLVRDLEQRELLVRSADPHDGRVWRLNVTRAGERLCAWFTAIEAQLAQDLLGGLSPRAQTAMQTLLTEMQARLNALSGDA